RIVDQEMTCFRNSAAYWAAACVAATCVLSSHRAMAEPPSEPWHPVHDETVDPDVPATYRLPAVGIFEPPQHRVASRTDAASTEPGHSTGPAEPMPGLAAEKAAPSSSPSPYLATSAEMTSQLLPAVQRGYDLAQRGAFFAARTEFVQVLRRVAQAKDAASGTEEHARALAAGLRALDEANDFIPQGAQVE